MRIYVFGDSYSVEFNHEGLYPLGRLYCDWKGYVPKKYFHHLKEHLDAELINNYSIAGNDNDNIFEKFTEVYKEIKDDDLIIFNWSTISRFSIDANIDYGVENNKSHWFSSISYNNVDWINKMQMNRGGFLYYNRIFNLIYFINETLKPNKVIHWTWRYNHNVEDKRTIQFETNGEINDFHYNEDTHHKLYENMVLKLKDEDKIFINLWRPPNIISI